jgi:hypothetical protein
MDISQLAGLGKVAGIGGIAVGAIVLLVRPLIDQANLLPEAARGPFFETVVIGAFAIGALGIAAWAFTGAQIVRTRGKNSAASAKRKSKAGGVQVVSTGGDNSPASAEQ